ncbi:unnamed protein product, partial [Allacma fusca]
MLVLLKRSPGRSRREHHEKRVMIATADSGTEGGYTSSESIETQRSRKLKSKKKQRGKSPVFRTKRTVATVKRR